jgi:hypothetical protein
MTPNEIATSISGLNPVGEGSVNFSTNPTFCWCNGSSIPDDQNSWD